MVFLKDNKVIAIALIFIIIIAFSLRFYPALLSPDFSGPDPYYHTRLAEQWVAEENIPEFDELSMQGRDYSYRWFFHAFLASFQILSGLPMNFLAQLLPAIYGVLSVLMVFIITRKLFDSRTALFSSFTLAFLLLHVLRTASYARPDSLSLLFVPLILYLVYRKNYFIASIIFACLSLLHPTSAGFVFIFLIFYMFLKKFKSQPENFKAITLILITGLIAFFSWAVLAELNLFNYVSSVSLESVEMQPLNFLQLIYFFSFAWIFVFFGLTKLKNNLFLKLWLVLGFIVSIFGVRLGIHFTIPAAILSGFGINLVLQKTKPFQVIALFLIFVLALMSTLPFLLKYSPFLASQDKSALLWIKDNSLESESILTEWDFGHPLTYLTGRKTVMDGYFEFAPDLEKRNSDVRTFLSTSDCSKIKRISKKYAVDFVFIPVKHFNSVTVQNGFMENECDFVNKIYSSPNTSVFRVEPNT
ncbi:MAG: glycosyltransferase family 39 protein [archaeon]